MKTLFTLILLASMAWPQTATISGQRGYGSFVYWGTATDSSLKTLQLVDNHYWDSSGTWVRNDNRADSCSRPFPIGLGVGAYPIWKYELERRVRSKDADSGTMVYRVETRYIRNATDKTYWGWRPKGRLVGFADVSILDSVIAPSPGVTTKTSTGNLFFVTGDEARLCPDALPGTANAATDSIFNDTLIVRRQ